MVVNGIGRGAFADRWRALRSWRLTRHEWADVAVLVLPLAASILLVKAYKLMVATQVGRRVGQDPIAIKQIRVFWAAASALCCLPALSRGARRRGFSGKKIAAVLAAGVAVVLIAKLVRSWMTGSAFASSYTLWAVGQGLHVGFEFFRGDALFVLGFGLLATAVLTLVAPPWRQGFLWAFRVLAGLLILLSCLDLGYFMVTGLNGSGFVLHYAVTQFSSLTVLIGDELHGLRLLVLFLPPVLLFATHLLAHALAGARPDPDPATPAGWPWALLAVFALGIVAPVASVAGPYEEYAGDLYLTIGHDFLQDPYWGLYARGEVPTNAPPLWDTRHLALAPTPRTRKLNVVLLLMESMSARYVTPYAPQYPDMPYLTELAKQSLFIEDMYTVIPRTDRAWVAVLDGINPSVSSVSQVWIEAEHRAKSVTSLPRLLRPQGYRSAFFSPAHLQFNDEGGLIGDMGFDEIRTFTDFDTTGYERTNWWGWEDRVTLHPIMDWVDARSRSGQPFFLTYMGLEGHYPYRSPTHFPRQSYPSVTDSTLVDYLNALHYMDGWIHDLVEEFRKRGLLDRTVFIILGDHGDAFGEHVSRQHIGVPYEEALKIPGLLYAPSLWPRGGTIAGLRQQIDLLPTLADLLGYRLTGGTVAGRSLLDPVPPDRTLYFMSSHDNDFLAMRQGNRKYIYTFDRSPFQIYDLGRDPGERHNLVDSLTPTEVSAATRRLIEWQQRTNSTLLSGVTRH